MVRFHWRDVSAFGHGRDDVEHWGEDESVTSEMDI
jgi:hypothetical protein